jgi:two-component system NtrC family sensor kinase
MVWVVRSLPIISIVGAVLLLALLLLVSTAKSSEAFRSIDLRSQYLSDLVAAIEQRVQAGLSTRSSDSGPLRELASRMPGTVDGINLGLTVVYKTDTSIGRVRQFSLRAFNFADAADIDLTDPRSHSRNFSELSLKADQVGEYLPEFIDSQDRFTRGYTDLIGESRLLVQSLRSSGRDELADQIFRTSNQILEYLSADDPNRQQQAVAMLTGLETLSGSLSGNERSIAAAWIKRVPVLMNDRQAMNDATLAMDLNGLADAIGSFRDQVTVTYVHTLSTINDARVLLNLYTVFLLFTLGYFGLRLRSSYRALNQSHGELEVRVQERTSDLEKAYHELQESQVQLVQAEKMSSLGQLVAGVMHEINTPLLYVLNNTSLTADVVGDLQSYVEITSPILQAEKTEDITRSVRDLLKHRERFDVAALTESMRELNALSTDSIEGLHQISDLVQSLKDFSRLDRAAEDRFNVIEGIEKTLTITRSLLKYGIAVEKHFDEVQDIQCSPARINQIFVNLVTNAAQAMGGKGRLTIKVRQREQFIEIRFTDTGCGIAQENLAKIMDPFFTTKPVGEGTGLGLSIVRQIIEQHHGHINIESEVGQGTRITLLLPTRPVADEEAA